jgi:hypothetical protein
MESGRAEKAPKPARSGTPAWNNSGVLILRRSRIRGTAKLLAVTCALVLCGILVAGLEPFHAPINQVTWVQNGSGLDFGRHGTILSSQPFQISKQVEENFCSVEVALQPGRLDSFSTIFAFFTPDHKIRFSLHQFDTQMALQNRLESWRGERVVVHAPGVFLTKEPRLIAIASGAEGTRIYVDGILLGLARQFQLTSQDCSGQLVVGTSPVVNSNWSGQLQELAFYNQELTSSQVARHFETWSAQRRFYVLPDEHPRALYRFDEHGGRVVHDSSGSGIDLSIPERYLIVREKFLEAVWREFHNDWGYWKNVLINIGGFVPLGLFFCALAVHKGIRFPALSTVILGAAVSLTIEVLQAFLPTRDSGLTDLITNTLGTFFGVMLYRWKPGLVNAVFQRVSLMVFR